MPAGIASDGEGLTFRPWTVSLRIALGDHLVGLYVYGSVVSGGFDPDVSDVDFVAVTVPDASALNLADLERMHRDLVRRHPAWNDRIEVVYIGQATLRSFRDAGVLAAISPGEPLHLRDDANRWLQNWYLVRETGTILYGPDPGSVIPPISRAEFLAAVALRRRSASAQPSVDDADGPRVLGADHVPGRANARHRDTLLEAGGGQLGARAHARVGLARRRRAHLPAVTRLDRLRRRADPCRCRDVRPTDRGQDRAGGARLVVSAIDRQVAKTVGQYQPAMPHRANRPT